MKPGNRIVYIIGFMGSGKSTAGMKLAASLDWTFIDLDRKIEEHAGKTIPAIFGTEGEDGFRKIESEILKKTGSLQDAVIAAGGGTPCHGDNMDYMLGTGLTICLKMTPEQLTKRLLDSTGERPLIKDIPDNKLRDFIEEKLADREKCYSRAKITYEGFSVNISLLNTLVKENFKL